MIDTAVFVVLLAAVSAVTLILFYRQTTGSPERYHSDMKAYILEMQGLESKYNFPYPVFFKLGALIHLFAPPELSVAVATMLLNSLGIVVTKLAFNRLVLRELEGGLEARRQGMGWLAGVFISLASVALFFVSMLYPPSGIYLPGIHFKYLGVFTANPFHNATYMAARPFAILAFLWYVKLLPVYEYSAGRYGSDAGRRGTAGRCGSDGRIPGDQGQGAGVADYVLFSVFLLVATMTKPSFTLVMVSTAGLVMLYRLIRSGFRNFLPTIWLGLCFVPTFLDLLYQFQGVFVPEEGKEGGVGFCFGEVWAQYCSNIPLAVCLAIGFPLLVLLLNFREVRKNTLFCFSWQLYLVGFAEGFLLYEKGFRKADFNFSWGYMYGIFFAHFGALLLLLRKTAGWFAAVEGDSGKSRAEGWLLLLQWAAFFCHLICGIFYFKVFLSGAMYY